MDAGSSQARVAVTRPLAVSSETSGENVAVAASGTHVAQNASTPWAKPCQSPTSER